VPAKKGTLSSPEDDSLINETPCGDRHTIFVSFLSIGLCQSDRTLTNEKRAKEEKVQTSPLCPPD
jgi:hypothetical protein